MTTDQAAMIVSTFSDRRSVADALSAEARTFDRSDIVRSFADVVAAVHGDLHAVLDAHYCWSAWAIAPFGANPLDATAVHAVDDGGGFVQVTRARSGRWTVSAFLGVELWTEDDLTDTQVRLGFQNAVAVVRVCGLGRLTRDVGSETQLVQAATAVLPHVRPTTNAGELHRDRLRELVNAAA